LQFSAHTRPFSSKFSTHSSLTLTHCSQCWIKHKSSLQQEWHGEASRGFAEQFDRLKTQSFNPMRQLLEDMGRQLSEAARVIQEMDQQMAGKFRG